MNGTRSAWEEGYRDALVGKDPKHAVNEPMDSFIEAYIRGYIARKAYEANPPYPAEDKK